MTKPKADIVINLRATIWQRDLINWAAQELGMTRTAFMLHAAKQDAIRVVKQTPTLVQP